MGRRRALLAGLGTSGLLIALALLLLAVVGALIAFEGGPVNAGIGGAEGVSLDQRRLVSAPPPSFAAVAVPAVRAARVGGGRHAARRSPRSRFAARQGVAGIRRTLRAGGAVGGGSAGATPGSSSGDPSKPAQPGADNVADAVKGVAGGAEQTIGNTTAPVGQLVRDTGSAVTETVRQLGSKVTAGTKP